MAEEGEDEGPCFFTRAVAGFGFDGEGPEDVVGLAEVGDDSEVFCARGACEEVIILAKDDETGHGSGVRLCDLEGDSWAHGDPAPDPIFFCGGEECGEAGTVGVTVEEERGVLQFGMAATGAEAGEAVEEEASRPEAALHGVADELEEGEAELGCEASKIVAFEEVFATTVSGDRDNAANGFDAVGDPEVEGDGFWRWRFGFFDEFEPFLVGGFPAPDAGDDLLGGGCAPVGLVEESIPAWGTDARGVGADPSDAVVHGEWFGFVEFGVSAW